MSQINNNTTQRTSRHRRYRHTRDRDTRTHQLPQLICPLRRGETHESTLRHVTRHTTVLTQGGIRKNIRRRQILLRAARHRGKTLRSIHHPPMTGVGESENERGKRTVEKPRTPMSTKHSLGNWSCIPHFPPLSSVLLSTTRNERAPRVTPHPRELPLRVVHQMVLECPLMAPSYHP